MYKYLPGSWADFHVQDTSYAVHVDAWDTVELKEVNVKRLLRLVEREVNAFPSDDDQGIKDFLYPIDESSYAVLTLGTQEGEPAIHVSVDPLMFFCSNCRHVLTYKSYGEFKHHEGMSCPKCHQKTLVQWAQLRICRCGHAEGFYIPKCDNKEHGYKFVKKGEADQYFVCGKCGKSLWMTSYCPECNGLMSNVSANSLGTFLPASLSIIDLLDPQKDVFLRNEKDGNGEKVIIARYLDMLSREEYAKTIAAGRIEESADMAAELNKQAEALRAAGLDDVSIEELLATQRRSGREDGILEAVAKAGNSLSLASQAEFSQLAEQILEYDELLENKMVLTLEQAAAYGKTAEGAATDYGAFARQKGFERIVLCSNVPIVNAAYGYTRTAKTGQGVKLRSFPKTKGKGTAYAERLETEGVLFTLDRRKILDWLLANGMIEERDMPAAFSEQELKLWFLDNIHMDRTGSLGEYYLRPSMEVYTLLHSVSHALIDGAAAICGLGKDSLSEYIFPNIPAVFIYCSNSQGFAMGALHSTFRMYMDQWLRAAGEQSRKCVFDPLCINGENKACAGCLYLNGPSCVDFNQHLNRGYLWGWFEAKKRKRFKGYWCM